MAYVVVPEKHDVKTRHLRSHLKRGIFAVVFGDDTSIVTGMKETNDEMGLFLLLDVTNPFAGATGHFLKA